MSTTNALTVIPPPPPGAVLAGMPNPRVSIKQTQPFTVNVGSTPGDLIPPPPPGTVLGTGPSQEDSSPEPVGSVMARIGKGLEHFSEGIPMGLGTAFTGTPVANIPDRILARAAQHVPLAPHTWPMTRNIEEALRQGPTHDENEVAAFKARQPEATRAGMDVGNVAGAAVPFFIPGVGLEEMGVLGAPAALSNIAASALINRAEGGSMAAGAAGAGVGEGISSLFDLFAPKLAMSAFKFKPKLYAPPEDIADEILDLRGVRPSTIRASANTAASTVGKNIADVLREAGEPRLVPTEPTFMRAQLPPAPEDAARIPIPLHELPIDPGQTAYAAREIATVPTGGPLQPPTNAALNEENGLRLVKDANGKLRQVRVAHAPEMTNAEHLIVRNPDSGRMEAVDALRPGVKRAFMPEGTEPFRPEIQPGTPAGVILRGPESAPSRPLTPDEFGKIVGLRKETPTISTRRALDYLNTERALNANAMTGANDPAVKSVLDKLTGNLTRNVETGEPLPLERSPQGVAAAKRTIGQGINWDNVAERKAGKRIGTQAYHILDDEIDRAVPGVRPLNERYTILKTIANSKGGDYTGAKGFFPYMAWRIARSLGQNPTESISEAALGDFLQTPTGRIALAKALRGIGTAAPTIAKIGLGAATEQRKK